MKNPLIFLLVTFISSTCNVPSGETVLNSSNVNAIQTDTPKTTQNCISAKICGNTVQIEVDTNTYFTYDNFDYEKTRNESESNYYPKDSGFTLSKYSHGAPNLCADLIISNSNPQLNYLPFSFEKLTIKHIEEINFKNYFELKLFNLNYSNKKIPLIKVDSVQLDFGG